MTDRLALILGVALAAAIGGDLILFGGDHLLYLGRKLLVFIDWIAFWR